MIAHSSEPKITANLNGGFLPNPNWRLKSQFHEVCRFRHVALRTEEACRSEEHAPVRFRPHFVYFVVESA